MNYQITKDNHVKWGFSRNGVDEEYDDTPPSGPLQAWIEFQYPKRPHLGLRYESILAAREMGERSKLPIMLALSGGIDSQVMTLAFLEAKVPFETLIVRYEVDGDCLNDHEIKVAYQFCEKHGITPREFVLDPRTCWTYDGYEQDIKENLLWTYLSHSLFLVQMHFRGTHNVVCGGGDPMLYPGDHGSWDYFHQTVPHSHHMITQDMEGTTKFFWWSPELLASQIDTPYMLDWARALPSYVQSLKWYTDDSNRMTRPYSAELYHDFCKPSMWIAEFPEVIQTKKHMGNEEFTKVLGRDFMMELNSHYAPWWDFYFGRHQISLTFDEIIEWARTYTGGVKRWNTK